MNVTIIGTGYVGLVCGACFAEVGNTVTCVDADSEKIAMLRAGRVPIREPNLDELVAGNVKENRLRFAITLDEAVADCFVFFIAVGTPPKEDGSADLVHVLDIAHELGRRLTADCTIVCKSTVPVGTADRVYEAVALELAQRGMNISFDVVSNPEFLKEGDAVNDFMRPDRIIVGSEEPASIALMRTLYAPFTRNHDRILFMRRRDAEMTKYVANAMLATKISFMNEIANLCEQLAVDVEQVRLGIGSDTRIGYSFIYPGCGYGGSCFPKDVKALIRTAEQSGYRPAILHAVEQTNEQQKLRLLDKITARFDGQLEGRTFALWGLAFKPGTDDLREAPAVKLIDGLIRAGARVQAYDPAAMDNARRVLPRIWFDSNKLTLHAHQYDALEGADALAIVTEWKPFRHPDLRVLGHSLKSAIIFDGRNLYDPARMEAAGFEYHGIGRETAIRIRA